MSSTLDAFDFSNSYNLLDYSEGWLEKQKRKKTDEKYLIALGKRIEFLIQKQGYKSPYAFWLEHGDEGLSRSNLNYLLNGKSDPKISTLRRIAEGLEIDVSELLTGL